jgi:hypothetical protein
MWRKYAANQRIQQVVDFDGDNGSATVDTEKYTYDGGNNPFQSTTYGAMEPM